MGYYDVNDYDEVNETLYDRMGRGATLTKVRDGVGNIYINNGPERVQDSIYDILCTPYGTRFFLPEYGCKVHDLMFEQNDFVLRDLAKDYVREALEKWEPRISIDNIEVESDNTVLKINIFYIIKSLGIKDSYVYTVERKVPELN